MSRSKTMSTLENADPIEESLDDFLSRVKSDNVLREHTQVATVDGWQSKSGVITHRFCVIAAEFHVPGMEKSSFLIRIDRRMRKDSWNALRGKADRKDEVTLSKSMAKILEKSGHRAIENQLTFSPPISLELVAETITEIHAEMLSYDLTKENCWAYTTFVLEFLQIRGAGEFRLREGTDWPNWAPEARDRIYERFRLAPRSIQAVSLSSHRAERQKEINKLLTIPPGSEFDRSEGCMEGTRQKLTEDVLAWHRTGEDERQIFWLEAHMGTGKTTFAHTIAALLHDMHCLGASFFFKHGDPLRDTPAKLFSSIARQLSKSDEAIQYGIYEALQDKSSLEGSSVPEQFKELIQIPCSRFSGQQRLVIVIDAIDEGSTEALIKVLSKDVPSLHKSIRFFITSRPTDKIQFVFFRSPHIQLAHIYVTMSGLEGHKQDLADENNRDLELFVADRFKNIARQYDLPETWPGDTRRSAFLLQANGVFIWAVTVLRFLLQKKIPEKRLEQILHKTINPRFSPEAQIIDLYSDIVNSCNWEDDEFVDTYHRVIGMMIVAREDLSIQTIVSLCQDLDGDMMELLRPLSPLILGLDAGVDFGRSSGKGFAAQPLSFLHLSCRDFLTLTEQTSAKPYHLNPSKHHALLSAMCLKMLKQNLEDFFASVPEWQTDSVDSMKGIPILRSSRIPSTLAYAIQHWSHHALGTISAFSEPLDRALEETSTGIILLWMKSATFTFAYPSLCYLIKRINDKKLWSEPDLQNSLWLIASQCTTFTSLLLRESRIEEAFASIQDAVQLYQMSNSLAATPPNAFQADLAASLNNPGTVWSSLGLQRRSLHAFQEVTELFGALEATLPDPFNPNLAPSLNNLSRHLSDLTQQEETLEAIQEAVELYRAQAATQPDTFNPDLAISLNNLSNHLSVMGQHEQALDAIQEAVELYRVLSANHPDAFMPDLAMSLNNLGCCLSNLRRQEQALDTIQEVVELRRALAAALPDVFNPELAISLNSLSVCLYHLGQQEQALVAIEEAVELYRVLAVTRPDAFSPELAMVLYNLSDCLYHLGQHQQALDAIQETVQLQQVLAAASPDAFNPKLALSLCKLSNCLSFLGQQELALQAGQKSVELYRVQMTARPDVFNPDLAFSLRNLSNCLSDLGQQEQASEAIQEAVKLEQVLATTLPNIFRLGFAGSLDGISNCLSDVGLQELAHSVMQVAEDLRRVADSQMS